MATLILDSDEEEDVVILSELPAPKPTKLAPYHATLGVFGAATDTARHYIALFTWLLFWGDHPRDD